MWEAANSVVPRHDNITTSADSSRQSDVKESPRLEHRKDNHYQNHHQYGSTRSRRVASPETIEAALSRLSKAYTRSIECIGAINKTNQMIFQQERLRKMDSEYDENSEIIVGTNKYDRENNDMVATHNALQTIKNVSNVARNTLETAILLDPLMLPHVPIFYQAVVESCINFPDANRLQDDMHPSTIFHLSRCNALEERRPALPTISSSAHMSTLVQLAYLSLVNYSDLLQQSPGLISVNASQKMEFAAKSVSILDRGITARLSPFTTSKTKQYTTDPYGKNNSTEYHRMKSNESQFSCWFPEDPEETQRLAVAALCDALNLDGNDPVTWLKLACASRRLERKNEKMTTVERSQHRRLQRSALERGSSALPWHLPPNRSIVRALEEYHREPGVDEYHSTSVSSRAKLRIKMIDLTRYSWSVLGKMILRACKGEESMTLWDISSSSYRDNKRNSSLSLFGSATVVIKLSPMLVLPSKVLGKICQYLENLSIWKFEATCRALSVNIIAARASMEESESDHDDDEAAELLLQRQEQRQKKQLEKTQNSSPELDQQWLKGRNTSNFQDVEESASTIKEMANEEMVAKNINSEGKRSTNSHFTKQTLSTARQSSRTSQRLRSQQISTGKKQDREAKRTSFDYCFLAATLSCTTEKHDKLVDEILKKGENDYIFRGREDEIFELSNGGRRNDSSLERFNAKYEEAIIRISDGSLCFFVERWSSKNSGPVNLLERYLAHIALYTEVVFASDSPTMGLHSCVLSSFQFLLSRSGSHPTIVPRFFQSRRASDSFFRTLELFAMDLIHAELIFRQCDRISPKIVEFDDDANLISLMVPSLVESCNMIKNDIITQSKENILETELCAKFSLLEIRCYWLTASFYLWRSRIARAIYLSREAEDEGIHFIEMTISSFDSPFLHSIKSVKTPHLVSPARQDSFWREISPISLAKFRDEIQASSVVSHARQRFQELVSNLKRAQNPDGTLTEISKTEAYVLSEIGRKLFERYNSQYGSSDSKLSELVENFIEMRGGDILLHEITPRLKLNDGFLVQLGPYKVEDLQRVSNPTILSMLIICLNINEKRRLCIAELLVRLVLTTVDIHGLLLKQIADFRATRKHEYHSDDAMSDSDDDMSDCNPSLLQKDDDKEKARQCGHFIKLLIQCLCIVLQSHLTGDERTKLLVSGEFGDMMKSALDFSNQWFQSTVRYLSIPDDTIDRDIFRLMRRLLIKFENAEVGSIVTKNLEFIFFRSSIQIIISQHVVLKGLVTSQVDRSHRAAIQRLCINRAEYIGAVASKLGSVLSLELAYVDGFVIKKGQLFEGYSSQGGSKETLKILTCEEEIIFFHAIRWLRKYVFQDDGECSNSTQSIICSSFDRPIIKELKIPISTLIIGLCGSASCSRQYVDQVDSSTARESCNLSLTEFFDSDASMNDWQSDSEDCKSEKSKKELIRVICHSVHCIILIFEKIDEKDVVNRFLEIDCHTEFGPLLPLVAARVLNFFADTLLMNFGKDGTDGNNRVKLWSEEYPFHTRSTGQLLDVALHKTYRWLYGFALVGEQNHQLNVGNELAHGVSHINEIADKSFKLENTVAAGQLYRCIIRAYAGGRRTPPKPALEAVSAALPPLRESEESKALRMFAFSGDNTDIDVNSLLSVEGDWDSPFRIVRDSIIHNEDSFDDCGETSLEELEVMQVRRGLSKQLSLGPLPIVSSDLKSKSEAGVDDDRAQTACNEREIAKKLNSILDDLCLSSAGNWEGWYRASQCCVMKADSIADRIGLTLGFSRVKNFSIPDKRGSNSSSFSIAELKTIQEYEDTLSKQENYLGDDYSVFMNCSWSSFSSLHEFMEIIAKRNSVNSESKQGVCKLTTLTFWAEIESKYKAGNLLEWQETCGGVFVTAFRNLSIRYMCVALYILQSKTDISSDHKVLLSDVCETLGNIFYSELMASQNYGYPMRVMSAKRKRYLAFMAKICFEASIKHADDSVEEDDDMDDHSTWDLLFMVGKCHEKIAATYDQEEFVNQNEILQHEIRLYEFHESEALSLYAEALAEATKLEESGTQLLDQAGGSGHGSTEILYRLHASRLKCLIRAVSRNEAERQQAELEALRLTEKYHFNEPVLNYNTLGKGLRERIWNVFADIVDGLAECRKLKQFFHRSIFRHAQALMWSPVLSDPSSSKTSKDLVPTTHRRQIKGLDYSKPAAYSAKEMISKLFDKKRTQLCAVWVTNSGAASPFQAINSTVRKYDSLRGKYIYAYLDALHLCNCRSEVETFLKWLYTSKRDHPSHYKLGTINGGEKRTISHAQDPLLITDDNNNLTSRGFLLASKRRANSILARILINEMSNMPICELSKPLPVFDGMKASESYLKNAYACYLRLNCSIEDLKKARAFKYGSCSIYEIDAMCQAYSFLVDNYRDDIASNDIGDWSSGYRKCVILKYALSKCKTLFPSLSAITFFGKSKVKKNKSIHSAVADPDESHDSRKGGSKRKSLSSNKPPSSMPIKSSKEVVAKKLSFEVAVPYGLKSGDTFLTSVRFVDSQPFKVKLTVPDGHHSTLRFNLNIPNFSPTRVRKRSKLSS